VHIRLDECPADEFALKLRIPEWAHDATLLVNNSAANVTVKPGTFAEIRRRWKAGDAVELQLAMVARLMEANPLVEETRSQIAIQRGPVVYCLESSDLPAGVRVQDVAIPANAKLSARYDAKLLSGVAVIDADAVVNPSGEWRGKLYRPRPDTAERKIKVRLIPYYAWSNRGTSEMSVWLPLK
jgi:DUF1680 family protein